MPPKLHTKLPDAHGERVVAGRLVQMLGDEVHLWFGVHVPGGNEIDLLLVHESIGAFVVEVKSKPLNMVLSYDLDSCSLQGQESTRTPVKQAHWAMTKLRTFLTDAGVGFPPFFFATACLPKIPRAAMQDRFAAEGIAGAAMRMHFDGLVFQDDLDSSEVFEARLSAITSRPPIGPSPNRPVPSSKQINQLLEATTGRGSSIPGATEPTARPQFVATPGKTQKDSVKRYLKPASRSPVVLRGYPGTGKTQALLDIAVAHADAGRQVLFTCYNKVLATALRASLAVRDVPAASRDRLLIKDVFEIKAGLTDEDLTVYAGTFGTVCVDEAQDMYGSLVEFVQQLAKPDAEWFLADGTGQELYDKTGDHFSPASELLVEARESGIRQQLTRQFRTSSAAALFAQGLFETALDEAKISGWVSNRPLPRSEATLAIGVEEAGGLPTITSVAGDDPAALSAAYAAQLRLELDLLASLGSPKDLMIMIPRKNAQHDLVRAALDQLAVPYLDQVYDDNRRRALTDGDVRLVTVHSARGVAATRAVLFGAHEFSFGGTQRIRPDQVNRNAGYIALTRARHGTRVVLVDGQPASQFQNFIVGLADAYGTT